MARYYYTLATLPALDLDERPFLTWDRFLDRCGRFVTEDDLTALRELRFDAPTSDPRLADWNAALGELRTAKAAVRAAELGWDAPPEAPNPRGVERLRQARSEDDPLKSEASYLRAVWYIADQLSVGDHFGFRALASYALRLQIATYLAEAKDAASGSVAFDEQYAHVAKQLLELPS